MSVEFNPSRCKWKRERENESRHTPVLLLQTEFDWKRKRKGDRLTYKKEITNKEREKGIIFVSHMLQKTRRRKVYRQRDR